MTPLKINCSIYGLSIRTNCAHLLFVDIEKEDALLHMLGEFNKSLQASLKSGEPVQVPEGTSPEEIFEALRGIPRLACANLLRAYSMLIRDDRRFRSLMALPKNMRKEWPLMEIGSI